MFRNHVAIYEVGRYAGHLAEKPAVRRKEYALALVRHFLSRYRENFLGFIPTKDYDKARAFYEGKLGFEFVSLDKFALVMSVGGHLIRITKVPNFTPLQATILGWQVEDIQTVAAWLRDRGAPPEKYPFAQDQDLGIWTAPDGSKVAWFKDPDGNILSISEHTP